MKIYLLPLFIFFQVMLMNNVLAQVNVCADQISYQVIENDGGVFEIEVKLDENSTSNFSLELFNLSDNQTLISERSINDAQKITVFRNLNSKHVFLIQAKNADCKVTLGGMNGIKVENK